MDMKRRYCAISWTRGMMVLFLAAVTFPSLTRCLPRSRHEQQRLLMGLSSSAYNFPFLATVHFKYNSRYAMIGSATILDDRRLLVVLDNFDRIGEYPYNTSLYVSLDRLTIFAGSDVMTPTEFPGVKTPKTYSPQVISRTRIKKIYAGLDRTFLHDGTRARFKVNPVHLTEDLFLKNSLGILDWSVAILEFAPDLVWTPYVLPMPLFSTDSGVLHRNTTAIIRELEADPYTLRPCSIGGWGSSGDNIIMTHQLTYVRMSDCKEAICSVYPQTCMNYPDEELHVCFKSLTYGDLCMFDQGSALYCPWFHRSAFAILTKTFSCGLESLPSVFLLVWAVVAFHEGVFPEEPLLPAPMYDHYELNFTARF